ncbi:MAG: N-acetylmuramoyl-L-alanine amidase [Cyanobacteria bacterium K_DeepCast_35m_m2_023]|nr:N-acetylmuramoyl-L-alanine amidase [Cyanobacteria bacterium K_DeepCast_35m_m2_023]
MSNIPRSAWLGQRAVVVLLSTAAFGIGALAWLGREPHGLSDAVLAQLFGQPSGRSLVSASSRAEGAAPPIEQPRWRTPLQRQCGPVDAALQQRLLAKVEALRASPNALTIDPTNYGERFARDAYGQPLSRTPQLIVLHETVYGIGSAINTFVTPHPRDDDQVSYHALIGQDGSVVQVLDPSKRAFGAGNSAFNGQWVVTNPAFAGSVNNFALHLSLETPLDGEDAEAGHSGYTAAQYDALAAVLHGWMDRFQIPYERITTHAYVDLGGERADPRSFDWQALQDRLGALGKLCR